MTQTLTRGESCHTGDLVLHHRLHRLINDVSLPEGFRVVIGNDPEADGGKFFLQIAAWRLDVITGEMGEGKGGKARPSAHACDSEIVGATFGLYKSYVEHEARETFKFMGRRIYGPHIDVFALWEAAAVLDTDGGAVREPHVQASVMTSLTDDITLPDGLAIAVGEDPQTGAPYLQFLVDGVPTGDPAHPQPDATETHVLDLAFGLYRAYVENQARETFLFRGRAIFSARVDAYQLHKVATRTDFRRPAAEPARQERP